MFVFHFLAIVLPISKVILYMSEQFCDREGLAYQQDAAFLYLIQWWVARAQENRRHVFEAINRIEPVMQFKTGHIGQAIVKNEEMWCERHNSLDSLSGSQMMESAMRGLLVNNLDKELADIRIIFNNENKFVRREIHIYSFPAAFLSRKP